MANSTGFVGSWVGWTGLAVWANDFQQGDPRPVQIRFELVDGSIITFNELRLRYNEIRNKRLGSPFIHIAGPTFQLLPSPRIDSRHFKRIAMDVGCFIEFCFGSSSAQDGQIEGSARAVWAESNMEDDWRTNIFILLLGDVGHGLERMGGEWLGLMAATLLNPGSSEHYVEHEEKIQHHYGGRYWPKHIKSTWETHRIG